MQLIDGKQIASEIEEQIRRAVALRTKEGRRKIKLATILVGKDGASQTYVGHKMKACNRVGFEGVLIEKDQSLSENELLELIDQLNADPGVDGILVQLPLPSQISEIKIIEAISPDKDVDGFHPVSIGRMVKGLPGFKPATPMGIMTLLEHCRIETEGKNAVVLGRSQIVGAPLSIMLSQKTKYGNATVTLCHSRTKNIKEICSQADILISALGVPGFVTEDMVKKGAVVIDVGTTRVEDASRKRGWRLSGDVDFKNVSPKCSFITPVPGGVGPMTIVSLLTNTLTAARMRERR